MAVLMVSGNEGRVRNGGTTIATVKMWRLNKSTAAIPVPNFESPVDADGNVWPEVLRGLSTGTISIEGQFNLGDVTDGSAIGISNGLYATLDLQLTKVGPFGYNDVYALCTSFSPTTNIENQAASFTAEFTTSGIVVRSGAVT